MQNTYQSVIEKLFAKADIRINGSRPYDIMVHDNRFYKRVLRDGQLGIGESYMAGWWDCKAIDEMVSRFIRAGLVKELSGDWKFVLNYLWVQLSNIGSRSKAFEVGQKHYDLGNELFRSMLDKRMIYSCGYWKNATTLDEAQEGKLDLICRKIGLRPGMKVLEIGCGFGGWARYAAENYGVSIVGITVSDEQAKFAREHCQGLPVDIHLMDYRDVEGVYDRVVSIAMFEAVGHKYFRKFMEVVDRCLKDDGLFLLHTIVGRIELGPAHSTWLNKYIFPNGELPSLSQLSKSVEGLFIEEAHHHLINHYEKTLAAWYTNFVLNWHTIQHLYDETFYRMWTFYLLLSRGIFKSRLIQLWQFVYSKNGIPGKSPMTLVDEHELFESR